jgi:hypothetical protein
LRGSPVTAPMCSLLRVLSRDRQCIEIIFNEQLMRVVVEALTSMQRDNHCWPGVSVRNNRSGNLHSLFLQPLWK